MMAKRMVWKAILFNKDEYDDHAKKVITLFELLVAVAIIVLIIITASVAIL